MNKKCRDLCYHYKNDDCVGAGIIVQCKRFWPIGMFPVRDEKRITNTTTVNPVVVNEAWRAWLHATSYVSPAIECENNISIVIVKSKQQFGQSHRTIASPSFTLPAVNEKPYEH